MGARCDVASILSLLVQALVGRVAYLSEPRQGMELVEGWPFGKWNNLVVLWAFWALQVALERLHVYCCMYVVGRSMSVGMCAGTVDS